MRDITFRTIGATTVLVGIAVAGFAQSGPGRASVVEIVADEPVTTAENLDSAPSASTTTVAPPVEYRIGLLSGTTTDNFWSYYASEATAWNAYVLGSTKPSLFGIDATTGSLVPDLDSSAVPASPTWNASGWHVRVDVNAGALWSDGQPIDAEDFEFTFETVRRLDLGGAWAEAFPDNVTAVVAESPTRLRFDFDHRPGLSDWPYGVGLAPFMPEHIWGEDARSSGTASDLLSLTGAADVSGGSLEIVASSEDRIVAAVNHDRTSSSVDRVVFEIFEDEGAAVAALEAGVIDTILNPHGISAEVVDRLAVIEGVALESSPANSIRYLGFNLERSPMDSLAFRSAVALLMDRDEMTESITPGADVAYTLVPAANVAWYDATAASQIASIYRGSLDSRLGDSLTRLAEAGYTWDEPPRLDSGELSAGTNLRIGGVKPAPLTILTPGDLYDPDRPRYAERIEKVIETLGFDVRLVVTDFDTVVDLAFTDLGEKERQYDMYLLGWTLGNQAYPSYYGPLFAQGGTANSTGYDSERFDREWLEFTAAPTFQEAKSALWNMEMTLAEDLPYLTLYHPQITEAYRSDRVRFSLSGILGGIQGRSGGLSDVATVG